MDIRKDSYKIRLNDPFEWLRTAEKLLKSAQYISMHLNQIIEENPEISDEHQFSFEALMDSHELLIGLALENCVKAVACAEIIKEKKVLKKFPKELKSHMLSDLYKEYLPSIHDRHCKYFYRIEKYVVWQGKYSIPLNLTEPISAKEFYTNDFQIADSIISEVKSKLDP